QAPSDPRLGFNDLLRFARRAWWVLQKVVFQGVALAGQSVRGSLPGQPAEVVQAMGRILVEVPLDAATRHLRQAGDLRVGQLVTLEPEDLHLLLDAWMGMMVSLV